MDILKQLSGQVGKLQNHPLAKLSPFLSEDGLIRLQGRLRYSYLTYAAKHPTLLPAKHPAVRLLLEHSHNNNYHEGTEYVRSALLQEYWIIGIRNALRSVRDHCVWCRKQRSCTPQPLMANLPKERVDAHGYLFAHTGVDYFGPFEVTQFRKTVKRWCCLFTCLTTRAVHIEVAHSLDTESCLAAVQRFISRRSTPKTIISDNGTNFVEPLRTSRFFGIAGRKLSSKSR